MLFLGIPILFVRKEDIGFRGRYTNVLLSNGSIRTTEQGSVCVVFAETEVLGLPLFVDIRTPYRK